MTAALQLDLLAPRWGDLATRSATVEEEAYVDPFVAEHEERLLAAGDAPLTFDEATWDHAARGAVGLDVEVYLNYFAVCLKRFADGKRLAFERSDRADLDPEAVRRVLRDNVIVTFNGQTYDLPILSLALTGADPRDLKEASDELIRSSTRSWDAGRVIDVPLLRLNHVDLMEPNPSVRMGLKSLAGRLHARCLVDLPYDPVARLTPYQMNVTTLYCQYGDLDATELLYRALREPLTLRVDLGRRHRADFRSRSDSQIGEAIVKREVERLTGRRLARPESVSSPTFPYRRPPFLAFRDATLAGLLVELDTAVFAVSAAGKVVTPPILADRVVRLGAGAYSMGVGGLHSTEAHRALVSDDARFLLDVDVASQYPSIIRNLGLYPPVLGPRFLDVYSALIDERLAAKARNDRTTADGVKIALNGVFGKLGSPFSALYAPDLLTAVTLTGQLAVLMLIERAELAGVPVVSANTDGVVFHASRSRVAALDEVLRAWEADTGFQTERTPYRALYSSSVNTYVAVREDGKVKAKGPIANPWVEGDLRGQMSKNPQVTICSRAVIAHLRVGVSLRETIEGGDDAREFVTVIRATRGATWRGHRLGKVVRYYWSIHGEPIRTGSGAKVARTEGARPLMLLPDRVPADVDRLRYCEHAARLLADLGVRPC